MMGEQAGEVKRDGLKECWGARDTWCNRRKNHLWEQERNGENREKGEEVKVRGA